MDTVPYGDVSAWATDPAVPVIKEDSRLYGRGASDMKSGLCAMAFALHCWQSGCEAPGDGAVFGYL